MTAFGSSGFNGLLTSSAIGQRKCRIMGIRKGIEIVSSADEESRSRRAYYPMVVDESRFSISLAFVSWAERDSFTQWVRKFMDALADDRIKDGVMVVQCPSRNFSRQGVPEGPLEYGEGIRDVVFTLDISFVASQDVVVSKRSYFSAAADDSTSAYFYPAATQVKGAPLLNEAATYDSPVGAQQSTAAAENPLNTTIVTEEGD